jgi:hypothetical protein
MRRMNRSLMLIFLVEAVLVWCAPRMDAGQKDTAEDNAPKPDGCFQVTITSISPGMGVSWADDRFNFNNQDYKFKREAQTCIESNVLNGLAGEQLTIEGLVYNLKHVSDFAGTYTRVQPKMVKAMGGAGCQPVFQNDQGVVVRTIGKIKIDDSVYHNLLGDRLKATLRGF